MEFLQTILYSAYGALYILFWGPQTIIALAVGLITFCIIYAHGMRIGPFKNIPPDPEEVCDEEY